MIARIATALKMSPSDAGDLPIPDAFELFDFWQISPPENELLAILTQVYTTWEPKGCELTEAEVIAAHRASLERRWKAGAMNAKQMYEAFGGRPITVDGAPGAPLIGGKIPGIGPFPGAH